MKHQLYGIALVALILTTGCTSSEDPRGTRVGVEGEVTLAGKPLDRARIVFHSADEHNPITATGSIVAGRYRIPAERGPLLGTMQVEIHPETIDLAEFEAARQSARRGRFSLDTVQIPARYREHSDLQALVTADESQNVFNFELEER